MKQEEDDLKDEAKIQPSLEDLQEARTRWSGCGEERF